MYFLCFKKGIQSVIIELFKRRLTMDTKDFAKRIFKPMSLISGRLVFTKMRFLPNVIYYLNCNYKFQYMRLYSKDGTSRDFKSNGKKKLAIRFYKTNPTLFSVS